MLPGEHLQHPPEVDHEKYRTLHGNATMLQLTSVRDLNTHCSSQTSHCQNIAPLSPVVTSDSQLAALVHLQDLTIIRVHQESNTASTSVDVISAFMHQLQHTHENYFLIHASLLHHILKNFIGTVTSPLMCFSILFSSIMCLLQQQSIGHSTFHGILERSPFTELSISFDLEKEICLAYGNFDGIKKQIKLSGIYSKKSFDAYNYILKKLIIFIDRGFSKHSELRKKIDECREELKEVHQAIFIVIVKHLMAIILLPYGSMIVAKNFPDWIGMQSHGVKRSKSSQFYRDRQASYGNNPAAIWKHDSGEERSRLDWNATKNMPMLARNVTLAIENHHLTMAKKCDDSLRLDMQEQKEPLPCVLQPVEERSVEPSTLIPNVYQGVASYGHVNGFIPKTSEPSYDSSDDLEKNVDSTIRYSKTSAFLKEKAFQDPNENKKWLSETSEDSSKNVLPEADESKERHSEAPDSLENVLPEQDENEISHSQLCSFYDEMQRTFIGIRPFSHYFVSDSELIVHVESPSQDEHSLMTRLLGVLNRCGMSTVEVTVKNYSADAQFCSGPCMGSLVYIKPSSENGKKQTLGMYLSYGNCVYWLSAAHAAIQVFHSEKTLKLDKPVGNSYITRIHIEEENLCISFDRKNRLPTPYLCFSYNNCKYSDDHATCHSVDIMIGPVPFTTNDLHSAVSQTVTEDMRLAGHRADEEGRRVKCFSTGIKFFPHRNSGPLPTFELKAELQDKFVFTTLDHEKPMILGKVVDARLRNCAVIKEFPQGPKIPDTLSSDASSEVSPYAYASNFIIIMSCSGEVSPKTGDSGSVWFIAEERTREGEHCKAVAVTIGIIEKYGKEGQKVWIATPLCAALFAISKKYPAVFPDYSTFTAAC